MRAGNLDRSITIERSTYVQDEWGTPIYTWSELASLRAQIIQSSTEEFIRNYGASDETVIIFRTRFFPGVVNADRIIFEGGEYNIKEVKEIGRRKGMDLRCVAVS
jgi:SPP1 family predicted phage head-tail adaptor